MATFTVWGKREGRYLEVYDVTYDAVGYPQFLIYDDGQWRRVSAKYYEPEREVILNGGLDGYIVERYTPVQPSDATFDSSSCKYCSNNPKNGGSGVCHCILGLSEMRW